MNIVTSANHGFFHCLAGLVESVHRHYGKRPIVYDLGLTDADRAALDAEIIPLAVPGIRHYWQNHDEPMIFLDADCLFMARVEETGFDLGVTLRTGKSLDLTNPYNGVLNAGVLFFNTPVAAFVDVWEQACRQSDTTDQKALVEILGETIDWQHYDRVYDWRGLSVKVFRTDDVNDYHMRAPGRIWHLKGNRHSAAMYEKLMSAIRAGKDPYTTYKGLIRRQRRWESLRRAFTWWGKHSGSDSD
ncbi:MAG: hypothetical protein NT031_16320 [Planctomycetota bacterium]|nr:hypothetical protein [Planctomycetota bacterium]